MNEKRASEIEKKGVQYYDHLARFFLLLLLYFAIMQIYIFFSSPLSIVFNTEKNVGVL